MRNRFESLKASRDHQKGEYWDFKLFGVEYPLAPRDLLRRKLVTVRNYRQQSKKIGSLGTAQAIKGINALLERGGLKGKSLVVLGPGLWERDLEVYSYALSVGLKVKAVEKSKLSCQKGRTVLASLPNPFGVKNEVIMADAKSVEFDPHTDVLFYCAEFWQILPPTLMEEIMFGIARQYRSHKKNFRMEIVHPLRQDNNKLVTWAGREFQGVEWGDTTPYSLAELKKPAEEGLRYWMERLEIKKEGYYHQIYSAWTFKAARK